MSDNSGMETTLADSPNLGFASQVAAPTLASRVVSLVAHRVSVPLKERIAHASHSRQASENIICVTHLDDGTVGYGEGVPRDYVTGETASDSMAYLQQIDWGAQLARVTSFNDAVQSTERLVWPTLPGDNRGCFGNAARCAAEMALLDAWGRRYGVSLARLPEFVTGAREIYQPRDRVRYSGVLTSRSTLVAELWMALKLKLYRFRHVKIKVGTAGQNDHQRLAWFRRVLGPRKSLRIDANEAWSATDLAERLTQLRPFRLNSVEQPVAHEEIRQLAGTRGRLPIPVMLDESLCSRSDAEIAIADGTCEWFNLRLSKCGGLLATLSLARLAHHAGIRCQLGCQVGETGILSAAGRAFATAVGSLEFLEGSYDSFLVRERLTRENLTFGPGGWAPRLSGPGLGITVEPSRLDRISVERVTLWQV